MRKITIILIAIMLFLVSGCSNSKDDVIKHNYTYKGENELWNAEYKVKDTGKFTKKDGTLHYEGNSNHILTVTYKKDLSKLSSVKCLEISYESIAGGGKSTLNFNDNPPNEKTYTLKSSGTGGPLGNKDQIIKVNINLDGKTQIIELKNR